MKARNGPAILIVFCLLCFAVCWFTITALTTPGRAIGSGIVAAAAAGVFIWFATTARHAVARGLIVLGATAFAAPLAALQAVSNDLIFSAFNERADPERFVDFDAVMQIAWLNAMIGFFAAVVLLIIGGIMHRPKRGKGDTAP